MRLDLAQFFRSDEAKSAQPVSFAAPPQFFETRQLGFAGGDDDLAAPFMRNAVLAAKFHHGRGSGHAQPRLQRSRLVVDPGVDDTAVVSALVAGDAVFFL